MMRLPLLSFARGSSVALAPRSWVLPEVPVVEGLLQESSFARTDAGCKKRARRGLAVELGLGGGS